MVEYLAAIFAGAISISTNAVIDNPLRRMQILLQTQGSARYLDAAGDFHYRKPYTSIWDCAKVNYNEQGARAFLTRGITPYISGKCASTTMNFAIKDAVKSLFSGHHGFMTNVISGAVSGGISLTVL